jgi:antirestriction protein ArdC
MKSNDKPKPDVYQMVTDRIIAALEKGVIPWHQPWRKNGPPRNLITGKHYRGINFWLLTAPGYSTNAYLSYKQVKELGGKIKEGEKGHIIVFWKQIETEDHETNEKKQLPFLRYYVVYNVEQCESLPESKIGELKENSNIIICSCEDIVAEMPKKPIIQHKGDKAFYNPLRDFVNMPSFNSFESAEAYYSILFHELVHSTGHEKRLARKELLQMAEFGSDLYSQEELTAELGSCFLKTIAGIDQETLENSAAYLSGWLKRLKSDKKCIIFASTQAQKATDFILGIVQPHVEEEVPVNEAAIDSEKL